MYDISWCFCIYYWNPRIYILLFILCLAHTLYIYLFLYAETLLLRHSKQSMHANIQILQFFLQCLSRQHDSIHYIYIYIYAETLLFYLRRQRMHACMHACTLKLFFCMYIKRPWSIHCIGARYNNSSPAVSLPQPQTLLLLLCLHCLQIGKGVVCCCF